MNHLSLWLVLWFAGFLSPQETGVLAATEPRAAVPVHQEPRHRQVHENPLVRVLDVRVGPGETTFQHVHADRMLGVVIAAARTWEQFLGRPASAPTGDLRAGQIIDNSTAN